MNQTSHIDPVCGMTVDPATPLRMDHGGTTYYFCAPSCLARFRAAPESYLGAKSAAPTNADEFAAWAGIGKRAAAKALANVGNVAPPPPAAQRSRIYFLPFRDNYTWFHRLEPKHGCMRSGRRRRAAAADKGPKPVER